MFDWNTGKLRNPRTYEPEDDIFDWLVSALDSNEDPPYSDPTPVLPVYWVDARTLNPEPEHNPDNVPLIAEMMKRGDLIPPGILRTWRGKQVLADGNHRVAAALSIGIRWVPMVRWDDWIKMLKERT